MRNCFHSQRFFWRTFLCGYLLTVWLYAGLPENVLAQSPDGQTGDMISLDDGTYLEITERTIARKRKQTAASDSQAKATLWSILADRPKLPLLFMNRQGEQRLVFFSRGKKDTGEWYAIRITDGHEQWTHPFWSGHSTDYPVDPTFLDSSIYFGRGPWLEQMSPEDGRIVARYPVREVVQSLKALSNGTLEVRVETSSAGTIPLHFQDGRLTPHLLASSYLPTNTVLFNRARCVMEEFVGTLDPFEYQGYLDLHRFKKAQLSPKSLVEWREFRLKEAESTYQQAAQRDPANPYFALYLELSIYYQDRQADAETYVQEAMQRSVLFWEESLRLGAICESLGLTVWADAFYTQSLKRYFQEAPAPPHEANLNEVLTFFLQRQSSTLFANGHLDRALHVLEIRRDLFPYTEGDNLFSRKYAEWLQHMGDDLKAQTEKQRIGRSKQLFDFIGIMPISFVSFWIAAILFLLILLVKNDVRSWYEFATLLIFVLIVDSLVTLDLFTQFTLGARTLVHVAGLLGYIGIIAFLRRQGMPSSPSPGSMMLSVALSSYVVLLRGMFPAYYLGYIMTQSQLGGKVAEMLFVLGFAVLYFWGRRHLKVLPLLRHFTLFMIGSLVFLGWAAWFHFWVSTGIAMLDFPLPWIDRGHPNWVTHIDQHTERALFQKHGMQFLQALVHQLHGDAEFAEQVYSSLPKDARALNNLGVLVSEKDPDAAQRYFEQALRRDPDFAPALYNSGTMSNDAERIKRAQILDGWKSRLYPQHAPERLWIAIPPLYEWSKTIYWSQGGFWVRGFLELILRFTKPEEFFQPELQHLQDQ
jgi:Tfp pilus assembly protein PilF